MWGAPHDAPWRIVLHRPPMAYHGTCYGLAPAAPLDKAYVL